MNEVIILRNRAHPFKTKFTQAFNVDWGDEKYPEAEFEQRAKEPIQIFDVKEFVKLRMKSKMGINGKGGMPGGSPLGQMAGMGAMGGMGGMGANPFAGLMGGGAPVGGSSPRSISSFEEMMKNQTAGQRPMPPRPESSGPKPGGFNIEELMKKIDAKIAELEAEEEAEKKANGESKPEENKINPLIGAEAPAKDLDTTPKKPVVDSEPDIIENTVKPASSVASFSDLMNKAQEPSGINNNPMVSNPIDTTSKAPVYPTEPIINKPLTGIIDPTKQMTYESFDKKPDKEIIAQPVVQEVKEAPAAPAQSAPVKPQPVQPKVNPYDSVSDDEFFDDFFDEE
jgi:hypothetical protein